MVIRSFVVAVLALSGCTVDLDAGVYACARSSCPSGWYCHEDSLCYRTEEVLMDAGVDSGIDAGVDAEVDADVDATTPGDGATPSYYGACASSAQCPIGACAKGPDPTAHLGQCSRPCASDAQCPADGEIPGVCIGGACLHGCLTHDDCVDDAFGCFVDPSSRKHACFVVDDPIWNGKHACGLTSCGGPSVCVSNGLLSLSGTCVVPCTSSIDECPFDATCIPMPANATGAPAFGCVSRCNASGDCDGTGCTAYPASEKHCAPSSWAN